MYVHVISPSALYLGHNLYSLGNTSLCNIITFLYAYLKLRKRFFRKSVWHQPFIIMVRTWLTIMMC